MDTTDTDTDIDQWLTGKPSTTIVALPGDAVNESREPRALRYRHYELQLPVSLMLSVSRLTYRRAVVGPGWPTHSVE